jgi:hypothetical protein
MREFAVGILLLVESQSCGASRLALVTCTGSEDMTLT